MVNGYFIIDAHCHIYPDKIAERAVMGTSKFYDLPFAAKGTVSDLIEVGAAGVDMCIVQSVATSPKQVKSINDFIADSVNESNGRLIGLGALHPDSTDLKGDIEHLMSLGLKGVKLHPDIQAFKIDDYRCLKIYELCEENNLPILMHTGDSRYDYSNPNRLVPVLKIYDKLTVIGAHFGGWSVWDDACRDLSQFENFYVDTSSCIPFLPLEKIKVMIDCYGTDKVMFGTDYPMWSTKEELESIFSLELTKEQYCKILSGNAKKLFKIG